MNDNNVYIFLDIDGVLATSNQYCTNKKKWHEKYHCYKFDEKCVKVFNQIVEKFKPIIILSSDWKDRYKIEEMNQIFEWNKINAKITDITPTLWEIKFNNLKQLDECRACEILQYVDEHQIINFLVIDDLDLLAWIPYNFIRTPKANEGIKQSGIKEKIFNILKQM